MNQTVRVKYSATDLIYSVASFGVTFTRLIMVIYASTLILMGAVWFKEITVGCIFLVMIFDYYDGFLFNRSAMKNVESLRIKRRLFDSLVDRIVVHFGCISLVIVDSEFLWFYIPILSREIIISGYCAFQFYGNFLIYPKRIAKLSAALVGLTVITYLTTHIAIAVLATSLMLIMSFIALREYQFNLKKYNKNVTNNLANIIEIF